MGGRRGARERWWNSGREREQSQRKGRGRRRRRWREKSEKETGVKERLLIMLTTRPKLTAFPHTHTHMLAHT